MLSLLMMLSPPALAFETSGADHLEIKWVRDSEEYALLTQQVYRQATEQVQQAAAPLKKRDRWVVVLDIDETTLDTSAYWLELASYERVFDWDSWNQWCERRDAPVVPGVVSFVQAVRDAGGAIAWISNRHEVSRQATIDNLAAHGLWEGSDPICLLTDDDDYTKRVRREELRTGQGACGYGGKPTQTLAWLGDTAKDLPEVDEGGPREDRVGLSYFVLPNPMYGSWEHRVTVSRAPAER